VGILQWQVYWVAVVEQHDVWLVLGHLLEKIDDVGVEQLKSRLSEYLRLVRSGETVLVTDRDEVVAELRPTRRQPSTADSLDELLDSLADRGEVTRASVPKRRWEWKAKGLGLAAGSAKAVLDEIRSDR
jgi:antitoxin (DNA-binding transcriptional repressor) of toxin-antitoxin stability system